jgi:hypothetical protein
MFIRWLVFIHVLSVITFFLAHGSSAAMMFKLRSETDFARIRALLDFSISYGNVVIISFLGIGITGLIMPFLIHIWNQVWIWLSIVLILFVFFYMFWFDERSYKPLRKLVGLPYRSHGKIHPAESPASPEEIVDHIKSINIAPLIIVGYGIPAFVLWLMVFKPF